MQVQGSLRRVSEFVGFNHASHGKQMHNFTLLRVDQIMVESLGLLLLRLYCEAPEEFLHC